MTIDITVHIPALDHLAQVLEGRDLVALVDNFHKELDERLDKLARHRVEAATAAVEPSKPEPDPTPALTQTPPQEAPSAPTEPAQPTPDMGAIRNACAALRDAGKLPAVQALLKETGAKNLSSLKPEQLPAFAAGLRELGATL